MSRAKETTTATVLKGGKPGEIKVPDAPPGLAKSTVAGVTGFCANCRFLDKHRRCHLNPPHTNNAWMTNRGEIQYTETEWCKWHEPRT